MDSIPVVHIEANADTDFQVSPEKHSETRFQLYERNRTVALTMGILRQRLIQLKDKNVDLPLEYEQAIVTIENFIYRYLTKKQDKRLVEQIVFDER